MAVVAALQQHFSKFDIPLNNSSTGGKRIVLQDQFMFSSE